MKFAPTSNCENNRRKNRAVRYIDMDFLLKLSAASAAGLRHITVQNKKAPQRVLFRFGAGDRT